VLCEDYLRVLVGVLLNVAVSVESIDVFREVLLSDNVFLLLSENIYLLLAIFEPRVAKHFAGAQPLPYVHLEKLLD